MDILSLPFNAHVSITRSAREGYLLELDSQPRHDNHLGTIHAAALFALAEATSGEFLLQSRGDRSDGGGVVRRSSAKYSRAATGVISSKVTTLPDVIASAISTVDSRGKALVEIDVALVDQDDHLIGTVGFTWLLARETT
jgi:acyl-coenzyme A thioesterase PaaI-like protein